MKKTAAIILAFLFTLSIPLSGCSQAGESNDAGYNVICTVFPIYDWTRQILGDNAANFNLSLLLSNKIDLHNYQPSVDDIVRISTCDLFIYVGGGSDNWIDNVLAKATNPNMIVISLLDILGDMAKIEEIIEGMEDDDHEYDHGSEDADDHDHDHADDHDHEDEVHPGKDDHKHVNETELDEHVWLSLRNAQLFCAEITGALSSLDANNAGEFRNNLGSLTDKLSALDKEYQAAVNAAANKTLLFGDRFPFRYLVDDYGISYYAAFAGCSAETEASFETIIFLAEKLDELNLNNVMVTESADQTIARTVISNSKSKNQKILVLDAMQSVTSSDVQNGTTYFSIMEKNLDVLKEALT